MIKEPVKKSGFLMSFLIGVTYRVYSVLYVHMSALR